MKPDFSNGDPDSDHDARVNPDIEVTEDELAALSDEVEVLHAGDIKEAADVLLTEKALAAIQSISKLATGAAAERVRLDASKYIIERVLGPLSKVEIDKDPEKDLILQFLKKLTP